MKRPVLLLSTVALAATGLLAPVASAQAAPAAPSAPAATIDWGPCTSTTLSSRGAECGFLSVPLDYAKPNGTKIKLAVSRIVHTVPDAQYQGAMLVKPGRPRRVPDEAAAVTATGGSARAALRSLALPHAPL